jgi:hypothetical protein
LYIATVVGVYKHAREAYLKDPKNFHIKPEWINEIQKISNRGYFTGFFMDKPGQDSIDYNFKGYAQTHHLAAKVVGLREGNTVMEARNPLIEGMELEWLSSEGSRKTFLFKDAGIQGVHKKRIRPNEIFEMKTPFTPIIGELIRKPFSEGDKVVGRE